jgi:hypothetical protein
MADTTTTDPVASLEAREAAVSAYSFATLTTNKYED